MARYEAASDWPQPSPLLTQVLAELVAEQSTPRAKAVEGTVRYSDAARCGRAIGLDTVLPRPEVTDVAGEFRMWLGTMLHKQVMAAIVSRYGGEPEATSMLESPYAYPLASGRADWVGVVDGSSLGRICFELKTEGSFGFDKATGLKRKNYSRTFPEGPRSSAKLQGALNAVAHDCDTLVIGVVAMDAVSVQLAEKVGLTNIDRIVAEWWYRRGEVEAWAAAELERFGEIHNDLANGRLPQRSAIGDEMQVVELDPNALRRPWQCDYCRQRDVCAVLPTFATIDQARALA